LKSCRSRSERGCKLRQDYIKKHTLPFPFTAWLYYYDGSFVEHAIHYRVLYTIEYRHSSVEKRIGWIRRNLQLDRHTLQITTWKRLCAGYLWPQTAPHNTDCSLCHYFHDMGAQNRSKSNFPWPSYFRFNALICNVYMYTSNTNDKWIIMNPCVLTSIYVYTYV